MTPSSAEELARTLCGTALLESEQGKQVQELAGTVADARALAQELLRRDWLTPYQVNQIFQGRSDQLILGQYVLLERLGEGGMGQVFKARQRNLGRIVALKVIRRECLGNPKVIQRFQREIRAAGQLSHPNIVRAYDADQANGTWYIALEYIDGIDLARLVREQGPLAVPQAVDFIRQAALGLQHAHERGLIHRDIKPANLLVTRQTGKGSSGKGSSGKLPRPAANALSSEGKFLPSIDTAPWGIVKILDMGLARWSDPETGRSSTHLTQMGSIMGTPDFIAPEQARNSHACDIRADLYSLGCTFYWLLTGRVPFPAGGLTERLLAHQFELPPRVAEVRRVTLKECGLPWDDRSARVPAEVQAVLDLLLAKKPEERLQTPNELAEILAGIGGELQPEAAPATQEATTPAPRQTPPVARVLPPKTPTPKTPLPSASPHPDLALGETSTSLMGSVIVAVPRFLRQSKSRLLGAPRRNVALALVGAALLLGMALGFGNRDKPQAAPAPGELVDLGPSLSPAEKRWQELKARAANPAADQAAVRSDLAAFRADVFGQPLAAEATRLLAALPSPFDRFDRSKIEKKFVFAWWPDELAGVLFPPRGLLEPRQPVTNVAVSPDGNHLAAAGETNPLRVWDPNTSGNVPYRYDVRSIRSLVFSPDGRWLAVGGEDGTSTLRNASNREVVHALDKGGAAIDRLAFHPTGAWLASAERTGAVRLWQTADGEHVRTFDSGVGRPYTLAFHPDGKTLFWGGSNKEVRWVDLATKKAAAAPFRPLDAEVRALAFHPDGRTAFLGGSDGMVVRCSWNGKELKEVERLQAHQAAVTALAFSTDGRWCVSLGEGEHVALWDGTTGKHVRTWEMRWPLHDVAWAPDGRHFVTANGNGSLFVWRLAPAPVPMVTASR